MSSSLLSKTIEDKRYLWLERTNQYVVLEQEAFAVAEKLIKGEIPETIATHLETTLSVPFEAALKFVKELEDQILNWSNNHWKIFYQSLKVFERSLLIKKRLYYKSITVLSL